MKNYYEILEVDIHASSEVIDKAFKVLAKKYHPDTQEDASKKQWAEEQFKMLNEAYEVLSDEAKREAYTKELEFDKDSKLNALLLKNADLEVQVEDLQAKLESLQRSSHHSQSSFYDSNYHEPQYQNQSYYRNFDNPNTSTQYAPRQTYTEEPVYYESNYHPIKSKLKSLIAFCITIAVIFLVGFLLWKIPFTHNLLMRLYENNSVIQSIVNLFC